MIDAGKVVTIDYAHDTQWMVNRDFSDWCRTYRSQRPGTYPLDSPGTQDITCEVAIDQLARVQAPHRDRSQAEFLDDFGLSELVGDARGVWHESSDWRYGRNEARARVKRAGRLPTLKDSVDTGSLSGYRED